MPFELSEKPLILAGPLLRRVEPKSVAVWVALQKERDVSLELFQVGMKNTGEVDPSVETKVQLAPPTDKAVRTSQIGENLFLACVQATPMDPLESGKLYLYDLNFGPSGTAGSTQKLDSPGVVTPPSPTPRSTEVPLTNFAYPGLRLPSFSLSPAALTDLKLVHTSCRKPAADGRDSLQTLDAIIEERVLLPNVRPHQLFLTGDQIYADDVSDVLLHLLIEAGTILVGTEPLPDGTELPRPGHRSELADKKAGLTAGDNASKSHLFTFSEFCAMYLFGWNQYLWPVADLPFFATVHPDEPMFITRIGEFGESEVIETDRFKDFSRERESTNEYRSSIQKVRRALANVPMYMVLDDHEVTDDFFLNRLWLERVLGKDDSEKERNELGRRIVQNGLLAFAFFQAWGNAPDRFDDSEPGGKLLELTKDWVASGFSVAKSKPIQQILRVQALAPDSRSVPSPSQESFTWHFKAFGPKHRVLVFDTRTRREYPIVTKPNPEPSDRPHVARKPANVIEPMALADQLKEFESQNREGEPAEPDVTFAITTLPFIPTPIIEFLQKFLGEFLPNLPILSILGRNGSFLGDFEGFEYDVAGRERLIAQLARLGKVEAGKRKTRIVLLSGDIHFSYAARVNFWAQKPFGTPDEATEAVFAQLVGSSTKKEESTTRALHRIGFLPLGFFALPPLPPSIDLPKPTKRAGWRK
jgi:hypothetical protein